MNKIFLISAMCVMVIGLVACDSVFPTPISKLLQSPRSYEGKQIMASGTVVEKFSILIVKGFVVRDDTGEITVITERSLPQKGEKVKVYGEIEEAFSLGDQQMIVLIERSVKP